VNAPRAIDRRALRVDQAVKETRWPRTARRQERVRAVLAKRQPDLTVVLENIHDPHNVSAILRTCDAVGVMRVHAVYSIEEAPRGAFARQTSASAAKWIEVTFHESIDDCYDELRGDGFVILATALAPGSTTIYEQDLTRPVALVLGNEMRGLSTEAVALADGIVEIPIVGMVQSLNVSVASAVCLYEAFRQRMAVGAYEAEKLTGMERDRYEREWLER
jgi:tRNA (guanosine-2'-O-)-methyltransferase